MRRPSLAVVVLALYLSLGSGSLPISARSLRDRPLRTHEPASSWSMAWEAVKKLSTLLKNGSGIDPFGRPEGSASTPPQPTSDNGSGIDPFGGR